MTEKLEMYRCEICGNLVQVIIAGGGELVCCGQPMMLIKSNTVEDAALEKHIPVFRTTDDNGVEIQVGSVIHPMNDDHYIMFIETISEDKDHVNLQFLHPGQEPKMKLEKLIGKQKALEFCNIHGLWEGESD